MRKALVVVIAVFSILSAGSCRFVSKGVQGSGVRKTEKREFAPFKSVQTSGAYEISITCQQAQSVDIEADDNILPIIKTEVRNGVLEIDSEQGYNSAKAVVIRIGVPDLEKFASAGAGAVNITNVKNNQLILNSNGAAKIEASGQTKLVDIGSNGAGHIDTSKLPAERAKVTVAGAANVDVYASQQLDVTVSGIGSVTYSGDPPVVNKSVSGIGSVTKKQAQ